MINWGRNFDTKGVYFKPEQLVTKECADIEEKLDVTHYPGTSIVPVTKKYMEQENFNPGKVFLMRRMLQSGYPFNCQIMRPGGYVTHFSSAKNIWGGVFYKNPYNQDDVKPSGDNQTVRMELERIGKCAKMPVDHIIVEGTNEPFLDPVMLITDIWEQNSKFLPDPVMFMTAYAHINGMPEYWYTQIHLFAFNGKCHLFPDYITANKTVDLSDKNLVKNILFNVESPDLLKAMANGLILNDPIWTTQEEVFETQAPIWFNRFLKEVPSLFERTRVDEYNAKRPIMYMISMSNEPDLSNIMTASWIQYPNNSIGYFNGYAYNKKTNKLVYGVFETRKNGDNYSSSLIITNHEEDVVEHKENNIVFRPGFKKYVERQTYESNDEYQQHEPEKFGTKLNIRISPSNDGITIGDPSPVTDRPNY